MNKTNLIIFVLCVLSANYSSAQDQDRQWTDASGHYQFSGTLIARDDNRVVIEKSDKSLVSVQLSQLSKPDLKFLEANEEKHFDIAGEFLTWHLEDGLTVKGAVVEYGSWTVKVQKRRSKIYVDDTLFANLPRLYHQIVPRLVAQSEKIDISKKGHSGDWKKKLRSYPKLYPTEGVMLEIGNGDLYAIPLFMFTAQDRRILEPGMKSWQTCAEDDHDGRSECSLSLRARTIANQNLKYNPESTGDSSQQPTKQAEEMRRIAKLQLQLQAYDAGVYDLWEVRLKAPNGEWRTVVVPARNNIQAQQNAQAEFPDTQTTVLSTSVYRRRR